MKKIREGRKKKTKLKRNSRSVVQKTALVRVLYKAFCVFFLIETWNLDSGHNDSTTVTTTLHFIHSQKAVINRELIDFDNSTRY